MALKEQVQRSAESQSAKDDEKCELHDVSLILLEHAEKSSPNQQINPWGSSDCNAAAIQARIARTKLVAIMLAIASGSKNFQPKLINWS